MSGPDGPEEREAWLEERFAADLDRLEREESRADEDRDDLVEQIIADHTAYWIGRVLCKSL